MICQEWLGISPEPTTVFTCAPPKKSESFIRRYVENFVVALKTLKTNLMILKDIYFPS